MSDAIFPTEQDMKLAVRLLKEGELVAFPTETVYGLGADASNPEAISKIFKTKGRPADHPVIVHLASSKEITVWAKDIPEAAWQLAEAFWPGPLTLILKKKDHVLDAVTGNQDSVGLRVPSHPVAQALLKSFEGGLAAPSANRFGHISPTRAEHVKVDFPDSDLMILDGGDSEVGLESTIVDLTSLQPRVLRPGGISIIDLKTVLPAIEFVNQKPVTTDTVEIKSESIDADNNSAEASVDEPIQTVELRASGLLDKHYAPKVTTYLVDNLVESLAKKLPEQSVQDKKLIGVIAFQTKQTEASKVSAWIELSPSPESYAKQLYSSMRQLEDSVDEIWIESVPDEKSWLAVRDRLRRATVKIERLDRS